MMSLNKTFFYLRGVGKREEKNILTIEHIYIYAYPMGTDKSVEKAWGGVGKRGKSFNFLSFYSLLLRFSHFSHVLLHSKLLQI